MVLHLTTEPDTKCRYRIVYVLALVDLDHCWQQFVTVFALLRTAAVRVYPTGELNKCGDYAPTAHRQDVAVLLSGVSLKALSFDPDIGDGSGVARLQFVLFTHQPSSVSSALQSQVPAETTGPVSPCNNGQRR